MKWEDLERSSNVEDRRGGGGLGNGAKVGGGAGIVGIIVMVVYALMGGDPNDIRQLQQQQPSQRAAQTQQRQTSPEEDRQQAFAEVVLKQTEDVWNMVFREEFNVDYPEPTMVTFSGVTHSGCGTAQSATGPFYCPADQKVYLDLSFFQDLEHKLGAGGDFAAAYVIAHEVGHHIQKLTKATDKVHSQHGRIPKEEYNKLSVRLELQADFYAGVWAHYADKWKGILDPGDVKEAINAANAIGDDRLQKNAQGYAVPESFTHGTSEQRMKWFMKGYKTGDIKQGNTFDYSDSQL